MRPLYLAWELRWRGVSVVGIEGLNTNSQLEKRQNLACDPGRFRQSWGHRLPERDPGPIARVVPRHFTLLVTAGVGRSDTREAARHPLRPRRGRRSPYRSRCACRSCHDRAMPSRRSSPQRSPPTLSIPSWQIRGSPAASSGTVPPVRRTTANPRARPGGAKGAPRSPPVDLPAK
jgi:hypothetical protein